MTPTGLLGTDISHWEDDPTTLKRIDFIQMKAAGAAYCIFKATQGAHYVDPVFLSSSWNDAQAAGLIRGAYHWLDWSADADKQSAHFCDLMEQYPPDIPPIVDFEDRSNFITQSVATSELWNFCVLTEQRLGRIPMIYTGPSYWQEFGSPAASWLHFPLWIAHYTTNPAPILPKPWTAYTFWQYTSSGNGPAYGVEAKGIDLDVYNGTLEELKKWLGMEVPPPPPAEPTDAEKLDILWREAGLHGWNLSKDG